MEFTWTEAIGSLSGALCVWLIVKENVWNWPLGLINNVFYFVIFYRSRLYADMLLQVFFFSIGVYGWWHWRFGDRAQESLPISRVAPKEWIAVLVAIPVLTIAGARALAAVNDAAPWADAFTTVLSLVAQTLMALKRIEHWWFWLLANLLYVPLYLSRQLPLTAVLYVGFFFLCVSGLRHWMQSLRHAQA